MANDLDKLEDRLDQLEERLGALEENIEKRLAAAMPFKACDECGVVFVDKDAYAEHLCQGKQGRRG